MLGTHEDGDRYEGSTVVVRLGGGLGNQLFQYAFGRRMALANDARLVLDASAYSIARDPDPRLGDTGPGTRSLQYPGDPSHARTAGVGYTTATTGTALDMAEVSKVDSEAGSPLGIPDPLSSANGRYGAPGSAFHFRSAGL